MCPCSGATSRASEMARHAVSAAGGSLRAICIAHASIRARGVFRTPALRPTGACSVRLFFALPLPKGAAAEVASVQARMRDAAGPAARLAWALPDQLHLTLSFLGEQPEAGP